MSAIPVQLDLDHKPMPTATAKLRYLQKSHQDLQQKYDQALESLQVNKKMLQAAMHQLHLFNTGKQDLQSSKDFACCTIISLQQHITTLTTQLQKQQYCRRTESSQLLISQQIRQQQLLLHTQILREYQSKILQLRTSIQDKQHHVQLLQETEMADTHQHRYKQPTKEIMKIINDYDISLVVVGRLKEENEVLKGMVEQEKSIVKVRCSDIQALREEIQRGKVDGGRRGSSGYAVSRVGVGEREGADGKERWKSNDQQSVMLRDVSNTPGKKDSELNGNSTQASQLPSKVNFKPRVTCQQKKNQTLFESIVMLYKREQMNSKLMAKRLTQIQGILSDTLKHKETLVKANEQLSQELNKLKATPKTRKTSAKCVCGNKLNNTFDQVTNENSIDTLFYSRKVQADQRKKQISELSKKFHQQVKLFELKLVHNSIPTKQFLSSSFTCLPIKQQKQQSLTPSSATPSKISQKRKSQKSQNTQPPQYEQFSRIMQDEVLFKSAPQGVTFADYFGRTPKVLEQSLWEAFDH